jgi:hypothetical protein
MKDSKKLSHVAVVINKLDSKGSKVSKRVISWHSIYGFIAKQRRVGPPSQIDKLVDIDQSWAHNPVRPKWSFANLNEAYIKVFLQNES